MKRPHDTRAEADQEHSFRNIGNSNKRIRIIPSPSPNESSPPSDEAIARSASSSPSNDEPRTSDADSVSSGVASDRPEDVEALKREWRTVSFGALADAQSSLNPINSHPQKPQQKDTAKLRALRAHIATLLRSRDLDCTSNNPKHESSNPNVSLPTKPKRTKEEPTSRTSKHAPASQSTTRAVPRFRPVVDHPSLNSSTYLHGDPRFDAHVPHNSLAGGSGGKGRAEASLARARENYAFLNNYGERELKELKEELGGVEREVKKRKKGKGAAPVGVLEGLVAEEGRLRVEIGRRENRMRAANEKEEERKVKRQMRDREADAVRKGVKERPYYAKKKDVREEVERRRDGDGAKDGEGAKYEKRKEMRKSRREGKKEMKRLDGVRARRA